MTSARLQCRGHTRSRRGSWTTSIIPRRITSWRALNASTSTDWWRAPAGTCRGRRAWRASTAPRCTDSLRSTASTATRCAKLVTDGLVRHVAGERVATGRPDDVCTAPVERVVELGALDLFLGAADDAPSCDPGIPEPVTVAFRLAAR